MSNFIVLVKQVPDISQISDNAFDARTGTLIRSRLDAVINELDVQALSLANQMRRESGGEGEIICLSMGPPRAESVLRFCLSRCADRAILLSDKRLGGADTVATANPLACAVRKVAEDILGGDEDYFVICGMQSVDGDTAQVPPQIAEELGMGCVSYVTDCFWRVDRFEFTRIISGGSQVVAVTSVPAVITVAKHDYPVFPTFSSTRRANRLEVEKWGTDDIKATSTGIEGSKTSVIRVFPPGKSDRTCRRLEDCKSLANVIFNSLKAWSDKRKNRPDDASRGYILPSKRSDNFERCFETTVKENEDFAVLAKTLRKENISDVGEVDEKVKKKLLDSADNRFHEKALEDMLNGLKLNQSTFKGEVWVIAEHNGYEIHGSTFELLGKARELADSLEEDVGLCLAGYGLGGLAGSLAAAGADKIYLIESKLLKEFDPGSYRKVIAECIDKHRPQIVLFGATPRGRVLAPMISYSLGCGLTADCTSLEVRDRTRRGQIGILLQTRPALGGNVMASICSKDCQCQMATARPGIMKPLQYDYSKKYELINHEISVGADDIHLDVIRSERSRSEVNFNAEVIVSGGKGMQNRDNYERLVGALCDTISDKLKVTVERGATRGAVERGFAERARQVGQTGTAVGGKLYVALGISGAIQHMIGIANTETIVAINTDPNAPILKQSDFYLLGSVEEKVPELVEELKGYEADG